MSEAALAAAATVGTQAEFARAQGWAKSYVSALKRDGRLVFTADGRVDYAASLDRIKATSGAPERAAPPVQGKVYSDAQDREKFYTSELRRIEYERAVRAALDRDEVDAAVDDVAAVVRSSVEAWRDSMPPQLAAFGGDEQRIASFLAGECEALLRRMADRLARMAADEEGGA